MMNNRILRVPDQNGVSLLYIMLEIHHSGREPSIYNLKFKNLSPGCSSNPCSSNGSWHMLRKQMC